MSQEKCYNRFSIVRVVTNIVELTGGLHVMLLDSWDSLLAECRAGAEVALVLAPRVDAADNGRYIVAQKEVLEYIEDLPNKTLVIDEFSGHALVLYPSLLVPPTAFCSFANNPERAYWQQYEFGSTSIHMLRGNIAHQLLQELLLFPGADQALARQRCGRIALDCATDIAQLPRNLINQLLAELPDISDTIQATAELLVAPGENLTPLHVHRLLGIEVTLGSLHLGVSGKIDVLVRAHPGGSQLPLPVVRTRAEGDLERHLPDCGLICPVEIKSGPGRLRFLRGRQELPEFSETIPDSHNGCISNTHMIQVSLYALALTIGHAPQLAGAGSGAPNSRPRACPVLCYTPYRCGIAPVNVGPMDFVNMIVSRNLYAAALSRQELVDSEELVKTVGRRYFREVSKESPDDQRHIHPDELDETRALPLVGFKSIVVQAPAPAEGPTAGLPHLPPAPGAVSPSAVKGESPKVLQLCGPGPAPGLYRLTLFIDGADPLPRALYGNVIQSTDDCVLVEPLGNMSSIASFCLPSMHPRFTLFPHDSRAVGRLLSAAATSIDDTHILGAGGLVRAIMAGETDLKAVYKPLMPTMQLPRTPEMMKLTGVNPLEGLNTEQFTFIDKVVSAVRNDGAPVHILEGYPGAGKTHALAALIAALHRCQLRILVCAPTNLAVANLAQAVSTYTTDILKYPSGVTQAAEAARMTVLSDPMVNYLDASRRAVIMTKRALDASITMCTVYKAAELESEVFGGSADYDVVIIDECAQTPVLASLIPLHFNVRVAVLAGDVKQMGPISHSALLGQSLQVLVSGVTCSELVAKHALCTQYRMNEPINNFISEHVYGGTMFCATKDVAERRLADMPPQLTVIVDDGDDLVAATQRVYKHLAEYTEDIGVIAPYKRLVHSLAAAELPAATVDTFQGQSRDAIIISVGEATRADDGAGDCLLFGDDRRVNVALSRARMACVVVGTQQNLETAGRLIRAWMKHSKIVHGFGM